MHRWFFPVLFTSLFFGLFGDCVRETGDRLRIIFSVDSPPEPSIVVFIPDQVRIRTDEYCRTGALIGFVYKRADRTGHNGTLG